MLIAAGFGAWAIAYILRSSFVGMDGQRYFALVDDAMISMRYAWNLSHGHGLVWNPGDRVEGYSNLLMVLWMAAATALLHRSAAALLVQLSGIPMLIGTAWLASRIAGVLKSGEPFAKIENLVFLGVLLYYPLSYWSLLGMETGLLAVFLTGAVLTGLRYLESDQPAHLYLAAAALGLAFLARNDSSIQAVIVLAYLAMRLRIAGRDLKVWSQAACIYLVFVAGQEAFRLIYYDAWLPNTYTLKLGGMPLLERLRNGYGFLIPFMAESSLLLVLAGVGLLHRSDHRKYLLGAMALASLAYQAYVGGDPWDRWRMLAPIMPLALCLSAFGAGRMAQVITRATISARTRLATGALLILGLLGADLRFLPELLLFSRTASNLTDIQQVNQAIALEAVTTRSATIGVIYAGTVPYFTGRPAIDFLGKSDRRIASLLPDLSGRVSWSGMNSVPGHNKYDLDYSIKQLRPTFVQALAWGSQDLSTWSEGYYVKALYKSVQLCLLRDSPEVRWSRVLVQGTCAP